MDKTDRKSLKKAIAILQIQKLSMPAFPRKAEVLKSFKKQLKKLRKRRKRKKLKKLKKLEKQKPTEMETAEVKAEEGAVPENEEEKAADEKLGGYADAKETMPDTGEKKLKE